MSIKVVLSFVWTEYCYALCGHEVSNQSYSKILQSVKEFKPFKQPINSGVGSALYVLARTKNWFRRWRRAPILRGLGVGSSPCPSFLVSIFRKLIWTICFIKLCYYCFSFEFRIFCFFLFDGFSFYFLIFWLSKWCLWEAGCGGFSK